MVAKTKEQRDYCKEHGICTYCGKPKEDDRFLRCASCRKRFAIEQQKRREQYRKLGLCVECGKVPVFCGDKRCEKCKEKQDLYNAKSLANRTKEKWRKANRDRYYRLKSKGLCTKCGSRKAVKWGLCIDCYVKDKRRPTRSKNGIPREQWGEYGLCYSCGKEKRIEGKKICAKCMSNNTIMQARQYINDHPWAKENNIIFKNRQPEDDRLLNAQSIQHDNQNSTT